ncbi:MAG: DUF4188 domain-containing protein [Rhodoblastus sp.]|nr:DUF4188 domain-containing protein [Rhodoblastus sp.]
MSGVMTGRFTAVRDEPFVVFVIGMRINRLWKVHRWAPVVAAMPRMIRELSMQPELGFLGGRTWFSRTIVMVQYWQSVEQLNAYAKARDNAHLPAWAAFNKAVGGSGDVGVFHETYRVAPGSYECVYVDMPRVGLGAVEPLRPAMGALAGAEGRMKSRVA